MIVKLNGEEKEIDNALTISQLLESLGIAKGNVAIELNENVILKRKYEYTILKDNDCLEIVRFVGGG